MDSRSRFRANFNRGRSDEPTTHQPQPAHQVDAGHQAPEAGSAHDHKPKKSRKVGLFFGRRWLLIVIIALALILVGLGAAYVHTRNELNAAKNPETSGKTEAEKIVGQINKTLLLPTGETPTLATVSDVSKLKSQTFFKKAENGDKVLIYSKAGRAVLYRPSTKQVIEYAPVNLGNNQ